MQNGNMKLVSRTDIIREFDVALRNANIPPDWMEFGESIADKTMWMPQTSSPVGKLMAPKDSRTVLRCGSGYYSAAVCVSESPFVLISQEGDMAWYSQDIKDHKIVGDVDYHTAIRVHTRYQNDLQKNK